MKANIRQRKNGTFEARCRVENKAVSKYGKTEHEARYKLKCYLDDIGIELEEDTNVRTLCAWLIEWFDIYKKPNIAPRTIAIDQNTMKNHISDRLKRKSLFLLTALDVQKELNAIESSRSKKFTYDILKQALRKAHQLGYTRRNIIEAVEVPRHRYKQGEALSNKEITAFKSTIKGNELEELFLFYLNTGARRNEALYMFWDDVNFENKSLILRSTKTAKKTLQNIRVVPFMKDTEEILNRQKEKKLHGEYVFPYNPQRPTRVFKKFCDNHKLHDLRHTFATRCVECGINIKVVQKWLGHSSLETTSNIYTHVQDSYSVEESKKFKI
ncbi:MAG: site-specific integrase [Bacillota bacterium]